MRLSRVVRLIRIFVGVGVFGTLTGFLATVFLQPSSEAVQTVEAEEVA